MSTQKITAQHGEPELVWRLRDREALERRFELLFGGAEHELSAQWAINWFIKQVVSQHPSASALEAPPYEDEWRWGRVRVRFRRYPEERIIEILEICEQPVA